MKKYVLILILLISCLKNQSKTVLIDKNINTAEIDSTEVEGKISTSSKKKSVQKYIDTLNIPSKYVVAIPLEINKKKIDIQLRLSKSEDFTITNGKTHRNELNKNFHVTLKLLEPERFEYHIEMSLSEKDFLARIADINDDVVLITDEYGCLKNVQGLSTLQDRVEKTIEKLARSYVGKKAEDFYQFLKAFF